MKCESCGRSIPESIGECISCNDGISKVYDGILEVYEDEASLD
jgi:hypothetical protein